MKLKKLKLLLLLVLLAVGETILFKQRILSLPPEYIFFYVIAAGLLTNQLLIRPIIEEYLKQCLLSSIVFSSSVTLLRLIFDYDSLAGPWGMLIATFPFISGSFILGGCIGIIAHLSSDKFYYRLNVIKLRRKHQ